MKDDEMKEFINEWNPFCRDELNASRWDLPGLRVWVGPLNDAIHASAHGSFKPLSPESSCSAVKQHCYGDVRAGLVARFICPMTCGCASPNSSLAFEEGCPGSCKTRPNE